MDLYATKSFDAYAKAEYVNTPEPEPNFDEEELRRTHLRDHYIWAPIYEIQNVTAPHVVSFVRDGEKINRVCDGVTTNMEYKINDKIQLNRTLKEFCGIPVTYTNDSMYVGKIRFMKSDFKSSDYLVKDKDGIYITNSIEITSGKKRHDYDSSPF